MREITERSTLRECLEVQIVEHIKPRAQWCRKDLPTRKTDLIDVILATVNSPAGLKEVWGKLDDLSRKAGAAALANGGALDPDAFRAQYGQLPWDGAKRKSQ